MSYGTYDNQSPLNQPFNPTANNGIGNDFGRVVGNVVADKLFGQNAQGPLSSLTRQIPGMAINAVANLPGAPQTPQQKVQQSQQGGGILKLRQQPPMLGPSGGGKSGGGGMQFSNGKSGGAANPGGGGKYATGGPAIEQPGMPSYGLDKPGKPSYEIDQPGFEPPEQTMELKQPYYINDGDMYNIEGPNGTLIDSRTGKVTGQATTANNFNTGY